ncbi:hypothetical protein [Aeoliella sp. SH292]|uniref:hypothetical protein n=1 Tax=Aeoliella sp. SH292 TaxID=3454464 RepID=UPI003F9480EC
MKIAIRSYLAGSYLLETEPHQWSTIAILDSSMKHSKFIGDYSKNHLYLTFDDIVLNELGKKTVDASHLERALAFAKNADNLLVCCRAGQSRSAATAFILSYALQGKEFALALLNPKRHVPNSFVVEQGARLLGKPEILHLFQAWRDEHRSVRLVDHYDEIEAEVMELERQGAQDRITR